MYGRCFDIRKLLHEWVYEMSFPILSVKFADNKNEIIIEQNPSFGDKDIIFKIPLAIKTKNMEKIILINQKTYILKLLDYNITYEDIVNKNNFIVINSDIKSFCLVNYLDEILKDAILTFYNNNRERNNINNNQNKIDHKYTVNDGDIYQILVLYSHIYSNKFINDIRKLKNIDNFEILYYIYYNYSNYKNHECLFFKDEKNNMIRGNNNIVNQLMVNIIDWNNTDLINKILIKLGTKNN